MPTDRINFGSRARVATLMDKLADATGNKNGIPDDETKSAGQEQKGGKVSTNPIVFATKQFFKVGWSKKDEEQQLTDLLAQIEKHGPVASIAKPAHVASDDWNSFRADKAIAAMRFDRAPQDIKERMVHAAGSVNGEKIEAREVFTQEWPATGTPKKNCTVVLSPGFLESGRNYLEQADLLNKQGYDVRILDHQWAGMTGGAAKKGGIDRGFGIARDVAAVCADVAAQQPGNRIVIAGTSMGGGAGTVLTQLLNDNGKIALDGPQMPKGIKAVGQDPYFSRSGGVLNATLAGTGHVPGVNQIPLPAVGAPILSGDVATLRKIAMHATTEELSGRPQAFHASDKDIATTRAMLESGELKPSSSLYVIHADKDTLASYEATAEWVKLIQDKGGTAHLHTLHSTSHVIEEHPTEQLVLLDALKWIEQH